MVKLVLSFRYLHKTLLNIFNISLQEGIVQGNFKVATVSSILKTKY